MCGHVCGFEFCVRDTSVNVNVVTDAQSDESARWRTFGERAIYETPELKLGQIDVELPDGGRHWHHVVRLQRAAMLVLLNDRDDVLLLWRHHLVPDKWGLEIPGGLVDEDEEPADAARRALEEETGYRVERIEHLITFQPIAGTIDSEHVLFVGRDAEKIGEAPAIAGAGRLTWMPLRSVPDLIRSGEIWNAGTLVALLRLLAERG